MDDRELSDRQNEIVERSMDLISRDGIQGLTMKKIALAIGITEPALYRHFQSKADILNALIGTLNEKRRGIAQDAERLHTDFRPFLEAFILNHARLFQQQPTMTLIIFSEELFKLDSELAMRVRGMMHDSLDLLHRRIRDAIHNKEIRSDIDPFSTTMLIIGGFRLLVSLWQMENHAYDLEIRTAKFLAETFLLLGL